MTTLDGFTTDDLTSSDTKRKKLALTLAVIGIVVIVSSTLGTGKGYAHTYQQPYQGPCATLNTGMWYYSTTVTHRIGGTVTTDSGPNCYYFEIDTWVYGQTVSHYYAHANGTALHWGHAEVLARSACRFNLIAQQVDSAHCLSTHNG